MHIIELIAFPFIYIHTLLIEICIATLHASYTTTYLPALVHYIILMYCISIILYYNYGSYSYYSTHLQLSLQLSVVTSSLAIIHIFMGIHIARSL